MEGTKPRRRPIAGRDQSGMRQVAERAGVSISSVSRVLSDHPDVSPDMARRVREAVSELGYAPDLLAQSLRRGATLTIGMILGDISNPVAADIVHAAEATVRNAGYSTILTNSENEPALDAQHVRLFQQRRVDGVVLSVADESHRATLDALRRLPVPFVLVDRDLPTRLRASAVLFDQEPGLRRAMKTLIDGGHRYFAVLTGSPGVRPNRQRIDAVKAAVGDVAGAEVEFATGLRGQGDASRVASDLLDATPAPTAFITATSKLLAGLMLEVRSRGLSIPADVSVLSCEELPFAELMDPPIATVARPPAQMGGVAAELLLERIRGGPARRVVLPVELDAAVSLGVARRR